MTRDTTRERTIRYFDYSLLFLVIFLLGFGLVMLYSVSSYEAQSVFGDPMYYLTRQIRNIVIGMVVMIIAAFIPYRFWGRRLISRTIFWLSTALCFIVLFVGQSANGSTRWLSIGGLQFQPSEVAKIATILYLAMLLSHLPKQIGDFRTLCKVIALFIPVILCVAFANLTTALIIAGICALMLFVASPKTSHFLLMLLLVAVVIVVFTVVSSYRGDRIAAWLHPEEYPDTAYQTLQGLYAIGSGGWFGKGLGGSVQKLGYVPEAQNDFIFSIICEELGLFGAICVIVLFILLIWRFMVICNNSADLFGSLVVVGVMSHIALQVILNLAVVTNSIPNTGVTLPFFSYGGSSMIFLMAEMGLVLSVSRGIHLDEETQLRWQE